MGCEEFLLQCLSLCRPPSSVIRHPPTSGGEPVDWSTVATIAADHGLAPLLYMRLRGSGAQALIPADLWQELRQGYIAGAVRSMLIHRELRPVLRRLCNSDIPVIVLKGAILAEVVYGDPALRSSMADVDFMAPMEELARVQTVLLDMGFVPRKLEDIELRCRTTKGLAPFTRSGFTVEPHWNIVYPTSPFKIDIAGLWARARPATIAGVEVLTLSPEDLLLHLCLHVCYQHRLEVGLTPFCDIAETIRRYDSGADTRPTAETTENTERAKPGSGPDPQSLCELRGSTSDPGCGSGLDWAQLVDRAREWGAARHVGLVFCLARSLLDAKVPDAVLEQLVPGGIDSRIREAARESVLAHTGYKQWVPFFDEFGARSFGDKARVSWERIFLPRDAMASRYPRSRTSRHLCQYYALRFRDAARAFGSYVLRRTRLLVQSRGRDPSAALVRWLKEPGPSLTTKTQRHKDKETTAKDAKSANGK